MLPFKDVCCLLEDVHKAKGLANKTKLLQEQFSKFRQITNFTTQENYDTFYHALRLIIPKLDHGRKTYNMKENKIARAIIKMLNLGECPDKRNLLNYHRINNQNISLDFADIAHSILRKYMSSKEPTIDVKALNNSLDSIANRETGAGIDDLMLSLFRKLSVQEMKWVIRIMLKDLKLGIDNNRILNIFHSDAVEYYSSNNNLNKVCEVLWSHSVKLNEFTINLFEPFQPMLSKKCDASSFTKHFPNNKLFYVENKFDGERFQIHMKDGRFMYFSRNGFDYTDKFGENFSTGILSPKLKKVFCDDVKSIILDGEMMLWNTKMKKFGSKGMTFDVKKLNDLGVYQPCFCVYDILLYNDEVLTNKELKQRCKTLKKAIRTCVEGSFVISSCKECNSQEEILMSLNQAMDKEEEGIIVKDPNSIYKYKNRNGGWFKIKMEYFEEGVTDLDLILMGAKYKANSLKFNSFIVGVFSGESSNTVLSMGRVSSGLSWEEIEIVSKRLQEKGESYKKFDSIKSGKLCFGKETPDVWIEPENTLIFTVRATELIRSTDEGFRAPYTLRFPRILRVREDKPFQDCLSINELLELCKQNKAVIKLNKRHLELEDILAVKRQKKIKKLDVDIGALQHNSNCLTHIKFYVISGQENLSTDQIEVLIGSYGGSFSLSLDEDVNIVIVGTVTDNVQKLLKKDNKFDVVKVSWLQRVIETSSLQKYKQTEVLSIGRSYFNCLASELDSFGDSYHAEIDMAFLKERFSFMAQKEYHFNLNNSIQFKSDLPLFNKYVAYFDKYEIVNNFSSNVIYNSFLDEIEFTYRKGRIADSLGPEVNMIIYKAGDEDRKILLENYVESSGFKTVQVIERNLLYEEMDILIVM